MGLFDIDDFQDKLNQEGQKYFDSVHDDFMRRQEEANAMMERTNRNIEKKDKERKKLQKAEHIARSREAKKRIFQNLEADFFSYFNRQQVDLTTMEDYLLESMTSTYKDLVPFIIGVNDYEGKVAVERTLKGYAKSLKAFGKSDKINKFWAEIFYFIHEGAAWNDDNMEYFHNILQKEIGGVNDPSYDEVETIESFLKRCYLQFNPQPYWGYDFEKDPIDKQVKRRLDYFSENIILDEDEEFDVIPCLDAYIRKHTVVLNEDKKNNTVKENSAVSNTDTNDVAKEGKSKLDNQSDVHQPIAKESSASASEHTTEGRRSSLFNTFDSLKKKLEDTRNSMNLNNSRDEIKKKVKSGLRGWLNKMSDKLND